MKKSLIALVAFAALFFLAACATPVESITLSATQVSLRVGETLQVNATVSPADADFDGFTWSSANTGIVTVNQTGLLTAVGAGTTSVTVAAGDRTGFVQVTVQRPADPVDPVDPTPEQDATAVEVLSLVEEITVDFGTSLADVVALFPSTATVVADNGETFEVTLRWIVYEYRADFDPEATSRYVASGLFTLPSGLDRGSIRTQIDTFVTVLPAAVRIALDVINFTPQLATVTDFNTAGVQGVNVNNLAPIVAALVAAKGTTEFPNWSTAVLQGVIDPLLASYVGTVFELPAPSQVFDMTIIFDNGTPVGIELVNGTDYRFFTDVQINELLWDFISSNAAVLNNQRVSFDFKAINTFSSLLGPDRLTYLELSRDAASTDLDIPNQLLFSNLIIDGQGFKVGNLTINAQNVVVRNLEVANLTLEGQARTTTLANVDAVNIITETELVTPTLRLNDVSFTGSLENRATLLTLVGSLTADAAAVSISGAFVGLNLVAGEAASVVTLEDGADLEDSEFGAKLTVLVAADASLDNAEFNGDVLSAPDGGVLTLTGLIELNGNDFNLTGSGVTVKLDGAQVYNALFVAGKVEILKASEIWNSTIGAVTLNVNANLVMAAPAFTATDSAVDVATKVTLTFVGGTFSQSNTLTVATPGSIVFSASATIATGKAITFSGSGLVSGLDNLNILLISDKLIVGESLTTNITGNAVAFQWQTATGAGVYANAATSPAFSATNTEFIRLVLEFVNTDTLITLSAVGPFDANTINVTASSVTIDSSFIAAASDENVEFDLVVKTENGYDLLSPPNVDVLISSASLTVTLTDKVITTGGIVEGITVNVTKAGTYSDLEVYVRPTGTDDDFTRVGTVSTLVVASTPVSVTVLTSQLVSSSTVGKGTSNEIVVLVEDVNGNPVNGAILSLGVTGVGLEAATNFASSTVTTNVSGQATLVLNTASNQINPITLSVTGATITSSDLEGDVLDLVRVVNNVNSSASMANTNVTVGSITFVLNLADGEQTGLPVPTGTYAVRLVNQAGTVIAQEDVFIAPGQTTVAAVFTVVTAAAYNVNVHVAASPGSTSFISVQNNYLFTLRADVFSSLVVTGLTNNANLALGSSNTVTLRSQDLYGNPVASVAVTYSAVLAESGIAGFGPSGAITTGSITTNTNGTATLDLRVASNFAPRANAITPINFQVSGFTVGLSNINTIEETISANSTAVISTSTPSSITASTGLNLDVVVTLRNISPSAMADGTYSLQLVLANGVTQSAQVALSNGTGTAQFTISQAGTYVGAKILASVTQGGIQLVEIATLGTFTIVPDATVNSTIAISPLLTSTAIRGNLYAITVTAIDGVGNKLSGVTISAVLTLIDDSGFRNSGTGFASAIGNVFSGVTATTFNTSTNNGEAVIFVKISATETLSLGNKYTLTITAAQGSSAVATDSDTFRIIAE